MIRTCASHYSSAPGAYTNVVRTINVLFLNEPSSIAPSDSIGRVMFNPDVEFHAPTLTIPDEVSSITSTAKLDRNPRLSNLTSPVNP